MHKTQTALRVIGRRLARCSEIAPLLVFYPGDGLDAQEKEQIDAHLAACLGCAQQLRQEQEMRATLLSSFAAARQWNPPEELLSQCRSELCDLLDDFSVPPRRGHAPPSGGAPQRRALRPMFG